MKSMTTFALLCGAGAVAAVASIVASSSATASPDAVTAASAMTSSVVGMESLAPATLCVTGFSKDACEGKVEPGEVLVASCDTQDCKTIQVYGAVYETTLKSSQGRCGGLTPIGCIDRCDQFRDGKLTLKFDYVLRNDSCCPYRGSWVGKWQFESETGAIYEGEAHGTLGVGTNRRTDCDPTDDGCERCLDVQLQNDAWLVGWEGSFRGRSLLSTSAGPQQLNFTMDGTWIAKNNGDQFIKAFKATNRFDGAVLTPCN